MDMLLKLYRISQSVNNDYDTYDSAVVAAYSENGARHISPSGTDCKVPENRYELEHGEDSWRFDCDWTSADNVRVEYIGIASESVSRGVICASFNAG